MEDKKDIKSMMLPEVEAEMLALGEKKFRAGQIFEWLHKKKVTSFDEMTNLSNALRQKLKDNYRIPGLRAVRVQISELDGTRKYAFALDDDLVIESVLMRYHHGNSVCISSQVGCRMGCRFCASTLDGLARCLSASEMLEQIFYIQRDIGERISNVVVMGMGEPLDNYEQLTRFIRLVSDEKYEGISQRNLTVSTCGLVPMIDRLADEHFQITLALSLHAPNDELRRTMMPIARKYTIDECLDACRRYFDKTGRRISFEYSLVRGVNDGDEQADELIRRLRGMNCHVNLIPINPIKERDFRETMPENVLKFQKRLEKSGINVTIRRRMGADIDSACGQLRQKVVHKDKED